MTEAKRTTSSRLLKNSAWSVSAGVFSGALTFLFVPFLLRHLGEQRYGVWVLIGSAFSYSSILEFGLSSAINRYIPVSLARGSDADIRRVASTGMVFFCAVGTMVGILTMVVYWGLTRWFQIPPEIIADARSTVLIVGGLSSIAAVTNGFGAILSGYQRYDLVGISRTTMVVLRAGILVIVLVNGGGLMAVAAAYGLTELGTKLMDYVFCTRLAPPRLVSPEAFDAKLLREMLGYGVNTFLYGAGALLTYKASELVIGHFLRTQDIALYSVAATGVLVLSTMISSICAVIKPAASDLDARGEARSVRELCITTQKYTLFLILPSTGFLIIMGREFLLTWTGLDTPHLPVILALLALGQAIQLAQYSSFMVMVGKGEHRMFGIYVVLIGLSTVVLSIINVGVLHLGLIGVAVSNLIPLAIVCGIVIPAHVNSRLGLSRRDRRVRVWKPVASSCVPSIVLLIIWKLLHPPTTWLEIFAIVVLTASSTAFAAWHWGLDITERSRFTAMLRHALPRFRSAG